MSDHVWVDPEGVRKGSTGYYEAADRVRALARTARQIATEYYGCWGDDDIGQKFSGAFVTSQKQICDSLEHLADRLHVTGEGVDVTGRGYIAATEDAEKTAQALYNAVHCVTPDDPPGGKDVPTQQEHVATELVSPTPGEDVNHERAATDPTTEPPGSPVTAHRLTGHTTVEPTPRP